MDNFPDIDYRTLGTRIRVARKEAHMTQAELAQKVGSSTSFMGHIERGSRHCSIETLLRLAITLNCSIDILLSDSFNALKDVSSPLVLNVEQQSALKEILRVFSVSQYAAPDVSKQTADDPKE